MNAASFDLKTIVTNIAERWKYKMEEITPGVFRLDVALKMKDATWRYQFVYIWIIAGRHFGKDVVYMNSRCGEYNPNLNHYKIIKESGFGTFAQVTITTDKRADGSPCETVIVQAVQPVELTNETILNEVIYDVAYNADIIEESYFGGDNN
ncbi:MAG: hypothetical protein H0W61_11475 [Bacteroidetes bacterium]|nr:hypothetical protein [Bacteroidota bacterium]